MTVNFIGGNDGGMGQWLKQKIDANEFDGAALLVDYHQCCPRLPTQDYTGRSECLTQIHQLLVSVSVSVDLGAGREYLRCPHDSRYFNWDPEKTFPAVRSKICRESKDNHQWQQYTQAGLSVLIGEWADAIDLNHYPTNDLEDAQVETMLQHIVPALLQIVHEILVLLKHRWIDSVKTRLSLDCNVRGSAWSCACVRACVRGRKVRAWVVSV